MNHLIPQLRADIHRRRQRFVLRHGKRSAVRKYSARAPQAELAYGQQVALDLQLGEAPRMRTQRRGAPFDPALQIALLLLEVLGPQKQPFGPDDAIVF